jgi:hypothetical protein
MEFPTQEKNLRQQSTHLLLLNTFYFNPLSTRSATLGVIIRENFGGIQGWHGQKLDNAAGFSSTFVQ